MKKFPSLTDRSLLGYEKIEKRIDSLAPPLDDLVRRIIIHSGGLCPYSEIEKERLSQEKNDLKRLLKERHLGTLYEIDMNPFGSWERKEHLVIFPEIVEAYLLGYPVDLASLKIEEVGDEFIDDLSVITRITRTDRIGRRRSYFEDGGIDKDSREILIKRLSQEANVLLDKERLLGMKIEFLLSTGILEAKRGYLLKGPHLKFWEEESIEKKRLIVFDYFYGEGGGFKIGLRDIFSSVVMDLKPDRWYPATTVSHICLCRCLSGSHPFPKILDLHYGRPGPGGFVSHISSASSFVFLLTGGLRLAVANGQVAAVSFSETAQRLIEERKKYLLGLRETGEKKLPYQRPPRRIREILNLLPERSLEGLFRQFNPRTSILIKDRPFLIEELRRELSNINNFKTAYQSLPQSLERVVNHLVSKSGFEEFARIGFRLNPIDLAALEEKGLVFGFPSIKDPEFLVLAQEYLFVDEMPDTDPQGLVAALKAYQAKALNRIAAHLRLKSNTRKVDCAIEIYSHLIENIRSIVDGLNPTKRKILDEIIERGGSMPLSDFIQKYSLPKKGYYYSYYSMDDLLPKGSRHEKPTDAQELLLSAILIPVGDVESWRLTIPTELYPEVARKQIEAEARKRAELKEGLYYSPKESETPLEMDFNLILRRFLLTVESIRPRPTRKGVLRKADLKKLKEKSRLDWELLSFVINFATNNYLIVQDEDVFVVSKNGIELMKGHQLLLSLLVDYLFDHLPKEKRFVLELLVGFKDGFIRSEAFFNYCRLESRTLHRDPEELIAEAEADIWNLLWTGFLKGYLRKDKLVAFCLSELGRAFLSGKEVSLPFKEEDNKLIIQPNNEIIAPIRMDFDGLITLAQFTSLEQVDQMVIFSISTRTLLEGLDRGLSVGRISEFLSIHSKKEIPQPVTYLLKEIEKREGELEIIPASGFLKVREGHIIEGLKGKVPFRHKLGPEISSNIIPILPGVDLERFERELKTAGYLPEAGKRGPRRAHVPPLSRPARTRKIIIGEEETPLAPRKFPFPNPAYDEQDIEEMIEFALENGLQVQIDYQAKGSRSIKTRVIEPDQVYEGLVSGYCRLRNADRVFRISRISQATLL